MPGVPLRAGVLERRSPRWLGLAESGGNGGLNNSPESHGCYFSAADVDFLSDINQKHESSIYRYCRGICFPAPTEHAHIRRGRLALHRRTQW